MTTTVTIKHEGPDHHDVEVVQAYNNGHDVEVKTSSTRLKMGESITKYVYGSTYLVIKEVEKE